MHQINRPRRPAIRASPASHQSTRFFPARVAKSTSSQTKSSVQGNVVIQHSRFCMNQTDSQSWAPLSPSHRFPPSMQREKFKNWNSKALAGRGSIERPSCSTNRETKDPTTRISYQTFPSHLFTTSFQSRSGPNQNRVVSPTSFFHSQFLLSHHKKIFVDHKSHQFSTQKKKNNIMATKNTIKYLGQEEALNVDIDLMGVEGFAVEQLMELAGLSCACSIAKAYPQSKYPRVLCIVGPGNNGGDALVCARHLKHFGYEPAFVYPKQTDKQLYKSMLTQCIRLGMVSLDHEQLFSKPLDFDLIVDGIFGFSFKGSIRAPFDTIIKKIKESKIPVVSVDIPSGWDVEKGNVSGEGLEPEMLVSLTAPKLCALEFKGLHYLGGRFVPPGVAEKYNLNLPAYQGSEQCIKLE